MIAGAGLRRARRPTAGSASSTRTPSSRRSPPSCPRPATTRSSGWPRRATLARFAAVFLEDPGAGERMQARIELTAEIVGGQAAVVERVAPRGETPPPAARLARPARRPRLALPRGAARHRPDRHRADRPPQGGPGGPLSVSGRAASSRATPPRSPRTPRRSPRAARRRSRAGRRARRRPPSPRRRGSPATRTPRRGARAARPRRARAIWVVVTGAKQSPRAPPGPASRRAPGWRSAAAGRARPARTAARSGGPPRAAAGAGRRRRLPVPMPAASADEQHAGCGHRPVVAREGGERDVERAELAPNAAALISTVSIAGRGGEPRARLPALRRAPRAAAGSRTRSRPRG